MSIRDAFRKIRGGRSQSTFSELLGHTQTWCSYIESGHSKPTVEDIERLSRDHGLMLLDGEWRLNDVNAGAH